MTERAEVGATLTVEQVQGGLAILEPFLREHHPLAPSSALVVREASRHLATVAALVEALEEARRFADRYRTNEWSNGLKSRIDAALALRDPAGKET